MADLVDNEAESDILSQIDSADGVATEGELNDDLSQTSDGTTQNEANDAQTQTQPRTGGKDTTTKPGEKPQEQKGASPQDLIDKDGNLIAKGGADRRHYDTAVRLRSENNTLNNKISELNASLDAVQKAGNLGTQYNLTPDQLSQAAQIMRGILDDPVKTLNFMLTNAQAAGHNVDGLGGGAMDMASIKQMIAEAVKPLTDTNKAQADTQRQNEEGIRAFNEFNVRHPDAEPHHQVIAQLIQQAVQQHRTLDVETAYLQLRNLYYQRNLDWTKPLSQIIQEARTSQNGGQDNKSVTIQGETIPTGQNNADVTDVNEPVVAGANADFGDIIKDSMKEAGFNFN